MLFFAVRRSIASYARLNLKRANSRLESTRNISDLLLSNPPVMGKLIACLSPVALVVTICGWSIHIPREITRSQPLLAAVQNAPKEKLLASMAAVEFGAGRGFYDKAVSVELVCATSGAVIRYTTNGADAHGHFWFTLFKTHPD